MRFVAVTGFLAFCLLVPQMAAATGNAKAPDTPTVVDLSQEPNAPSRVKNTQDDSQRYAFLMNGSNARLQVRINDVPVMFKIFRTDETVDFTYNEWLKRGLNIIELQVQKFSEQQPYKVNYQVYFQSPSQIVTNEKTVLVASPDEVSLPLRQPVGIRAQSIAQMRIWQAEKTLLTTEEKRRLLDLANSFRTRMVEAISKGDNAFLASYDKLIRDDIERAYGRLPESESDTMKRRMALAESFAKMVNASVEISPELKVDDINFETIADGQLVRLLRKDGNPVINITRGDLKYVIDRPIYGNMGGVWELMRVK